MSGHDAFERSLASLYDARLDDVHWPATTALIDATCGSTSNVLLVGEGPPDDIRVLTASSGPTAAASHSNSTASTRLGKARSRTQSTGIISRCLPRPGPSASSPA